MACNGILLPQKIVAAIVGRFILRINACQCLRKFSALFGFGNFLLDYLSILFLHKTVRSIVSEEPIFL